MEDNALENLLEKAKPTKPSDLEKASEENGWLNQDGTLTGLGLEKLVDLRKSRRQFVTTTRLTLATILVSVVAISITAWPRPTTISATGPVTIPRFGVHTRSFTVNRDAKVRVFVAADKQTYLAERGNWSQFEISLTGSIETESFLSVCNRYPDVKAAWKRVAVWAATIEAKANTKYWLSATSVNNGHCENQTICGREATTLIFVLDKEASDSIEENFSKERC